MPKRKHIKLTSLAQVFREIAEQSMISRSEQSMSWDFDRSSNYLCTQGLRDHICFVSRKGIALPLNSERHKYDLYNVVVRNLAIELDDKSEWDKTSDWEPISSAKLHFEGCRFESSSPNMWSMSFPWRGTFRYEKNEFSFPSKRIGGVWIFSFRQGSRAWLIGNDFTGSSIQTRCINPSESQEHSEDGAENDSWWGRIAFVANKGIHELWTQEGYSTIEITGMNRIDQLSVDLVVDSDPATRTSIYLGPRERIDPAFHNCLQHRSLFLHMRQIAAMNHDNRQLVVLDRQLERIEYFLNKGQETPSILDYGAWIEYWQDRILHAWRRWSSDFYRSWLRPLVVLIVGYLVINMAPAFFVESFLMTHWMDFTLRPITEIATYEGSLGRIVGDEYKTVPAFAKSLLKLAGLVEVVWIGVWGFALAKSIKR